MSDWQDIATAPRDGTRVLLWFNELDPHTIQSEWRDEVGWVDVWNNDRIELTHSFIWPTHWMSLPEPPHA